MSIEVTGNYRPARPNLAIVVSGLLLALTLAGAGVLTYSRNRPISLAAAQKIPAVQGLQMAWPAGWTPVRLPTTPGPAVAGFADTSRDGTGAALFLLTEQVSNTYVSPRYATWHVLQSAARQLGFVPVSERFATSTGEMLGRPAFQMAFAAYYRQNVFGFVLRVVSEPNGMAIGLLLMVDEQVSPASERIVDAVTDSMQLRRHALDAAAGLRGLGLAMDPQAALGNLQAHLQEVPAAGTTGVTLVPEGAAGAGRYYAINVWTTWLANRRTLQDIAAAWYRRQSLEPGPPGAGDWVQRSGSRIWKMVLSERVGDTDRMVDALYLKELPDRRVVWAHTTAGAGADPEPVALDLLASIQKIEQPDWTYDVAVTTAGTVLARLADGPLEEYYRVNQGRLDLVYTAMSGREDGAAQFVTTLTPDGTLTRSEQVEIGPQDERLTSQKQSMLRVDLSAFQVKDVTQHSSAGTVRISSTRADAADPVGVAMQFSRGRPMQSMFSLREPFLPDPAYEAAAWHLARQEGSAAVFRIVGMDPEVPESLLVAGLGRRQVDTASGAIEAWTSLLQEDTASGPMLVLFDDDGRLIGYVLQGGASLLRKASRLPAERSSAEAD